VRRLILVPLLAVLLAGCAPSADDDGGFIVPQVGPAKIDVDTPALRAQKKDAGIEACVPGTGQSDLPAGELPCLGGGQPVDLSTLTGPRLINIWAYWCVPCRREMPIYAEFASEHGDVVPVLGVNYQDTAPDEALGLLRKSGATFPQLADPQGVLGGGALGRYNPDKFLPIVLLVGADGRVYIEYRQIKDLGELEDLVTEHLGVTL